VCVCVAIVTCSSVSLRCCCTAKLLGFSCSSTSLHNCPCPATASAWVISASLFVWKDKSFILCRNWHDRGETKRRCSSSWHNDYVHIWDGKLFSHMKMKISVFCYCRWGQLQAHQHTSQDRSWGSCHLWHCHNSFHPILPKFRIWECITLMISQLSFLLPTSFVHSCVPSFWIWWVQNGGSSDPECTDDAKCKAFPAFPKSAAQSSLTFAIFSSSYWWAIIKRLHGQTTRAQNSSILFLLLSLGLWLNSDKAILFLHEKK
jgi:hypothetical protein